MDKKNKVIEFIKNRKVQVALAAGTAVGVITWLITRDKAGNYIDITRPTLPTGEWALLQRGIKGKFNGCVTGCATAVDITDLGKFGDALATIEGIDGHEQVRIIFGTEKKF